MVDEVLLNTIGLVFGFGAAQVLGDFAESKIKPDIVTTSTSQDKMVAEVANDGSKLVLAYGLYSAGRSSAFIKSAVAGTVLSTMFDAYWRYAHDGVPFSGYKLVPIETPAEIAPAPTSTPTGGTPSGTSTTPTGTTTTPTGTTTTPTGEPDIGLLDSYYISNTDTLEDIMEKGRILEEM